MKKKTSHPHPCAYMRGCVCLGLHRHFGQNPSTAAPTEQAQLPTEAPDYSDLDVWKSSKVWSKGIWLAV